MTKVVLLSGKVDPSHSVNDEFSEPFVIPPPTTTAPEDNLKFELEITIHRRGYFVQKLRLVLFTRLSLFPSSHCRLQY